MQGKLPLSRTLNYECANPDCYYCGTILWLDDVVWKEIWNSEIHDLDCVAHCPSCVQPMMIWEDEDGKDESQAQLS